MLSILCINRIWNWGRKAQKDFEQANILVGPAKQLYVPLPQCLFLIGVTSSACYS